MCHCYLRQDGLGAVIVTDKEYPARVAFNLRLVYWMTLMQSICISIHFDNSLYRARWKNAKEDNQFPVATLAKTIQDYQVFQTRRSKFIGSC